jgi:dihydroxyacetone kinase
MNNAEIVKLSLAMVLAAIEAIEDELGKLDAVAGDGDHGMGMVRGLRAAVAAEGGSSPKEILSAAGAAFADAAGGSSGALVGVLINTIAQSLPDENIGTVELHSALQMGLMMMSKLGKAKVGDKTMIDTLEPFVNVLGANTDKTAPEAWSAALPAAEQGMNSTVEMIAKRGRSSKLGERSRGTLDPGAVSMYHMLRAVGEALQEGCDS